MGSVVKTIWGETYDLWDAVLLGVGGLFSKKQDRRHHKEEARQHNRREHEHEHQHQHRHHDQHDAKDGRGSEHGRRSGDRRSGDRRSGDRRDQNNRSSWEQPQRDSRT